MNSEQNASVQFLEKFKNFSGAIVFWREVGYRLYVDETTIKIKNGEDTLNYLNSLNASGVEKVDTEHDLIECLLHLSGGEFIMPLDEYEQQIDSLIQAKNNFCDKFGHLKFAIGFLDYDSDERVKPSTTELTSGEEIISYLTDSNINWTQIQAEKELISQLFDSHDDVIGVEPLDAYRKRQQDMIRQELEHQAHAIATKYKCCVNSLDFLNACQSEIQNFQSYQYGLREDGLCIGYGVTPGQWFEEMNASRIDVERIEKLIDWIATNMPLLYGQWQYNQQLTA